MWAQHQLLRVPETAGLRFSQASFRIGADNKAYNRAAPQTSALSTYFKNSSQILAVSAPFDAG